MRYRERRVADAIRDIVAEIVLTKISDPKIGFVTITRCSLSRDLRNATVFFTVMGDEEQQKVTLLHLEHARGFIRHLLGRRLKMKFLPVLHFAVDEILLQEERIDKILDELNPEKPKETPDQTTDGSDARHP